jgi:hypothetical protein
MPTLSSAIARKKRIGQKQWELDPGFRDRRAVCWPVPDACTPVHEKLSWAIGYIRCGMALPVSGMEFNGWLVDWCYFFTRR